MKRNAGRLGGIVIAGVIALMIMTMSAFAATLPAYENVGEVNGLARPIQVSADADGYVYVGEKVSRHVTKYTAGGSPLYTIALPSAATAVKIGSNGLLYIGIPDKILVYNGTQLVDTITGVVKPVAIDVASNGDLYILDPGAVQVKILKKSGEVITIGGYETMCEDMRDLTLDEANGEFYLLDRNGNYTDSNGSVLKVWRVKAYDLNGNALAGREFSHYGYGVDGSLVSASNIAIDEQRRIYVADNAQNIIGVYDHTGGYIGTLYDPSHPYNAPTTLDYKNNRLYFVSYIANNLRIVGLEGYANLTVNPAKVLLNMQNGVVYGSRSLTLSNTGSGAIQWNIKTAPAWLSMAATSGSIAAKTDAANEVTIDTAALGGASASGVAVLGYNGGESSLTVEMNAVAPPALSVSADTFEFVVEKGSSDSGSTTVTIANDFSASLQWAAVSHTAWLKISPETGSSSIATIAAVTVNATGLAVGSYTGSLTVSAPGVAGVVQVNVTMTVTAATVPPSESALNSIVTTLNGASDATEVRIFDGQGVLQRSFTAAYPQFKGGLDTAIADVNGDGKNDIITGLQFGSALLKVHSAGGALIAETAPLFIGNAGVKVAAADFDGDGKSEIVVMRNKGAAGVKILGLNGSAIEETGVSFNASVAMTGADLQVAAGAFDGETVVVTVMDNLVKGTVKIWSVDTGGGPGSWSQSLKSSIDFNSGAGNNIVGLKIADIDADGDNEIMVALKQGNIVVIRSDGSIAGIDMAEHGLNDLDLSDLNNDGNSRIVTGLQKGYVGISDMTGLEIGRFRAFNAKIANVRVSAGELLIEKTSLGGVQ
ncbi:MAG: VCBS repeat-containing protein [Nitrospirae bacterium]|nr:VCBS repeat-containing protein [Nitrospirota bacterium]